MTVEEAFKQIDDAKSKAHEAARKKLYPSGMVGPTSSVVDDARLRVLEATFAALMAERSSHDGSFELKTALELRDYWESVAEEIGAPR